MTSPARAQVSPLVKEVRPCLSVLFCCNQMVFKKKVLISRCSSLQLPLLLMMRPRTGKVSSFTCRTGKFYLGLLISSAVNEEIVLI